MTNKTDLAKFKELVRKSIGARSQAEFASEALLSPSHLTRMLNDDYDSTPHVRTIRNIAAVAVNGVTLNDLLVAAGYEPQVDGSLIYSEDGNCVIVGITEVQMNNYQPKKEIIEGLINLRASKMAFDSIEASLGDIEWDMGAMVDGLQINLGKENKTTEDMGYHYEADYCISGTIECVKNNVKISLPFILYYCKTDTGNVIIMDTEWEI